jgi:hypothetical protein
MPLFAPVMTTVFIKRKRRERGAYGLVWKGTEGTVDPEYVPVSNGSRRKALIRSLSRMNFGGDKSTIGATTIIIVISLK